MAGAFLHAHHLVGREIHRCRQERRGRRVITGVANMPPNNSITKDQLTRAVQDHLFKEAVASGGVVENSQTTQNRPRLCRHKANGANGLRAWGEVLRKSGEQLPAENRPKRAPIPCQSPGKACTLASMQKSRLPTSVRVAASGVTSRFFNGSKGTFRAEFNRNHGFELILREFNGSAAVTIRAS